MIRFIEDRVCHVLDRDDSWLGVRRLKPATDQPYTSPTLAMICLLYGALAAASGYGLGWLAARAVSSANPLRDDSAWLPRSMAWGIAVIFFLSQWTCMWLWNRRASRLNPSAFRHGRPRRGASP